VALAKSSFRRWLHRSAVQPDGSLWPYAEFEAPRQRAVSRFTEGEQRFIREHLRLLRADGTVVIGLHIRPGPRGAGRRSGVRLLLLRLEERGFVRLHTQAGRGGVTAVFTEAGLDELRSLLRSGFSFRRPGIYLALDRARGE